MASPLLKYARLATLICLVGVLVPVIGFSQNQSVKGTLASIDTAELTILNIYPDSFPNVSVVFKAETRTGEPVWGLTKEKMRVNENGEPCEVISVEQISTYKSIQIGIVVDHSGSMLEDISELFDANGNARFSMNSDFEFILPQGYMPPIDRAKEAVKLFISSFNPRKDSIALLGFSHTVDIITPLSQDLPLLNKTISQMEADGGTALYDAMMKGLEETDKGNGIKALVVLTDGWDNASKYTWNDVTQEAIKRSIPIHIIGLGDVDSTTLTQIASASKGKCYFTKSSGSLNRIYESISRQIQAYYNLVYHSPNLAAADGERSIELTFDVPGIYLESHPDTLQLPPEVITYLQEKEQRRDYMLYGGLTAIGILITSGVLLFSFVRKKKPQPIIKKVYPNPSTGSFQLEYDSPPGNLELISMGGVTVKTAPINGTDGHFDFEDVPDGIYILVIRTEGTRSNAIKFIIQK